MTHTNDDPVQTMFDEVLGEGKVVVVDVTHKSGDISMCNNNVGCGLYENCWRFNAPPHLERQSYLNPDYDEEEDECTDYIPMDEYKISELPTAKQEDIS